MKSKLFALLAAALAMAFLLAACSDKNENQLTEGDPEDPNFQSARMITNGIIDSLFLEAEMASDFINFDGTEPMNTTEDSLLITFDEATCWWAIYLSTDTTNVSLLFIDSVKFHDADGCQQFPDSLTTTEIEYRAFLDINVVSDSGSLIASASDHLLLEGIQEDTCVINAGVARNLDLAVNLTELSYDYDGALDDIRFLTPELMYEENPRPVAGTMILSLTIYGSSQQGSVSHHWIVTVTFGPTGYHARAESGENYWEWDVTYVTRYNLKLFFWPVGLQPAFFIVVLGEFHLSSRFYKI